MAGDRTWVGQRFRTEPRTWPMCRIFGVCVTGVVFRRPLQAKEVELQLIDKVLEDSALTSLKFRQWKEANEHLLQEIERLTADRACAIAPETGAKGDDAGAKGDDAAGLRLSFGEQLVDAELSGQTVAGGGGGPTSPAATEAECQEPNGRSQNPVSTATDNYFYI